MGDVGTRGVGGGGTPLYKLYRHVAAHRVGFLRRCGLKTGIRVVGWNRVWFLRELRDCMNSFIVSIPNEYERKKNMTIRNGFEEFFGLRSKVSNDNIIFA